MLLPLLHHVIVTFTQNEFISHRTTMAFVVASKTSRTTLKLLLLKGHDGGIIVAVFIMNFLLFFSSGIVIFFCVLSSLFVVKLNACRLG